MKNMEQNSIIPVLPLHFNSLSDLNHFHDYMTQLFKAHQILIMRGKTDEAIDVLENFRELQIQHIKDEEELLIPVYRQKINQIPPGGAVEFYLREHRQIEKFLDRLLNYLQNWAKQPESDVELVNQFERCYRFKDLVDHHDAREKVFLYRLLDQKMTESEKRNILDNFSENIKKYHVK